MKNVLVLGSTSLIANGLIEILSEDNEYCVQALGRHCNKDISSKVEYCFWDIYLPFEAIKKSLKSEYQSIIVLAWDGNKKEQRDDEDINHRCSMQLYSTLMNICCTSNVKQIILCGSQAEYGKSSGVVNEYVETNFNDISSYGKAKLDLYNKIMQNHICENVTELRFHSVYGYLKRKKQMITSVVEDLLDDKNMKFYTDGSQFYDFLYYTDASKAIYYSITKNLDGVYNISSNEGKRFKDYISEVSECLNLNDKIKFGIEKSDMDFIFDSSLFRSKTNWDNDVSFKEGIRKVVSEILYEELYTKNVIIYGAGYCGLMFSDLLIENGVNLLYFMDKNEMKHSCSYNGIKIISPDKFYDKEALIIVSLLDYEVCKKIQSELKVRGYLNVKIIFDFRFSEKLFKNQPLIFYTSCDWCECHYDDLMKVKNLLSDELSVITYEKTIDFISGDLNSDIPSFSISQQYFAYDVYKKNDCEVFIDCGAFKGDILKYFNKNVEGKFESYYLIEPDPDNYSRIQVISEMNRVNVHLLKYAVSDCNEELYMKNYLNENSKVCDSGFKVSAIKLDDICDANDIVPTFIKIDVEGYEDKVLNGASKVISKVKPTLAIAIYHQPDDLWKIPLKIHEMLPDHKLYIRSYMNVNELILYAVPQERCVDLI